MDSISIPLWLFVTGSLCILIMGIELIIVIWVWIKGEGDMTLFKRYRFNSKPEKFMSKEQLAQREIVNQKIKRGEYIFEYLTTCPLCGFSQSELIAEKDRYGMNVKTVICLNCGLLFQNPRMNEASSNKFYAEDYRILYASHSTIESFFNTQVSLGRRRFEFLSQYFIKDYRHILDFGCGAGGNLVPFIENKWQGQGYDMYKPYLDCGRQHGLNVSSDKPQGKFDVILLNDVLEHFTDIQKELSNIKTLCHADTLIYVECPGLKSIWESDVPNLLRDIQLPHNYYFDKKLLMAMMQKHGFKALYCDEVVRGVFTLGESDTINTKGYYADMLSYLTEVEKNWQKNAVRRFFKIKK